MAVCAGFLDGWILAGLERRTIGTCLSSVMRNWTRLGVVALAGLMLWPNRAEAEMPPAPKYQIVANSLDIYNPAPGFENPLEAKGYIEAVHLTWPWGNGAGGTWYCSANASAVGAAAFLEMSPPQQNSAWSNNASISRNWLRCTGSNSAGYCISWACGPDPATYQYQMMATCPSTSLKFRSNPNRCECSSSEQTWSTALATCVPIVENDLTRAKPRHCPVGNPIYPMTGRKTTTIDTGLVIGGVALKLTYDNSPDLPTSAPVYTTARMALPAIGPMWTTSFHRQVLRKPYAAAAGYEADRGDGTRIAFLPDGSGGFSPGDVLTSDLYSASSSRYFDRRNGAIESYLNFGLQGEILRMSSLSGANGEQLTFAWSRTPNGAVSSAADAVYLLSASDAFGRKIEFRYDAATGVVNRIVVPEGRYIDLGYNAYGLLSTIAWQDGTVTQLRYEGSNPRLLTSLINEAGIAKGVYGYDVTGRAVSTSGPGGVDAYSVSYAQPPSVAVSEVLVPSVPVIYRTRSWLSPTGTTVTGPLGATSSWTASGASTDAVASRSQPAGAGCAASSSQATYDANGNVASSDDFNGNRSCSSHDLSRNLENVRVEGLATGVSCVVTGSGATIPAGGRKISTQWHPDWSLRTKVAEPGRLTTYVYNGQPDPFAGGTASCAPAGALMPDGKPIAVLCRKVEQATTDADGSTGLAAQLQGGVASRVRSWTYDQHGRVLTETDPRAKTTVYAYYTTTSFTGADPNAVGYSVGDLQSVTDAAGLTTSYPQYDKAGNWLQRADPNSVVTTRLFDSRQRLTSSTTAGLTTTYEYWPTGQLKKTTQPDNSWVQYTYDDAQRLWKVEDNLGNKITYTLDNFGNRTAEEVKDAAGVLRRQLARSIDTLGRVQQLIGRE